jgi:hypothetical protein
MGGTGGGSTEKEENDKENNGDNDSVAKYQVVFSKTLLDTGSVVDITNALNTVDKTEATFVLDSVEKTDLEIVFGKTTRAISTEAYRLLERMDAYGRESRFLIYSDGKSVAIAFDEDEYKERVQEHIKDAGAYDYGTASKQAVNIIEKYCIKRKYRK